MTDRGSVPNAHGMNTCSTLRYSRLAGTMPGTDHVQRSRIFAVALLLSSIGPTGCGTSPSTDRLGAGANDGGEGGRDSASGQVSSPAGDDSGASSSPPGSIAPDDSGLTANPTIIPYVPPPSAKCSGTYSGTFQCTFVFGADGGAVSADAGGLMVTGTLSFKLTQMTGGEAYIAAASGSFSSTGAVFFTANADIGGTLNCNTGVFQGNLSNGMYSGFVFITGTFSGPLDATYNSTTLSFVNGTWLLTVPGQGSCPGTWTANYSGP